MLSGLGIGPNISDLISSALEPMKRMNLTVDQEMQAYQRDQNPAHLLNVISILQQVIAENLRTMQPISQIGATLEGAFTALQPGLPGPSLPNSVLTAVSGLLGKVPPPQSGPALQLEMSRMSRAFEMISEISKKQHDTAMTLIQNLR